MNLICMRIQKRRKPGQGCAALRCAYAETGDAYLTVIDVGGLVCAEIRKCGISEQADDADAAFLRKPCGVDLRTYIGSGENAKNHCSDRTKKLW